MKNYLQTKNTVLSVIDVLLDFLSSEFLIVFRDL